MTLPTRLFCLSVKVPLVAVVGALVVVTVISSPSLLDFLGHGFQWLSDLVSSSRKVWEETWVRW